MKVAVMAKTFLTFNFIMTGFQKDLKMTSNCMLIQSKILYNPKIILKKEVRLESYLERSNTRALAHCDGQYPM